MNTFQIDFFINKGDKMSMKNLYFILAIIMKYKISFLLLLTCLIHSLPEFCNSENNFWLCWFLYETSLVKQFRVRSAEKETSNEP